MGEPVEPDPILLDLLVTWEERKAAGQPVTPEEVCRDRPERLEQFLRALEEITRIDPLLADAVARPAAPPRSVPGFEQFEEVGQGGMGTVYRAWDIALKRTVAIKFPHARGGLPVARGRFEREAQTLAQLRHPNIVSVHFAGWVGDEPYFVMDYVPGGNLAQHRGAVADDFAQAAAFLEAIARAVEHAHRNGVVHRDLKPSNILIDGDGRPQVADFGVAAILAGESLVGDTTDTPDKNDPPHTRITRTGAFVGTPAYAAPEAFGGAALTPAADVWSLGVIFYELLTGRVPFPGSTSEEVRERLAGPAPPPANAVRREVPKRLAAIATRCLAKEPADRYPSAGAVADALARWRRRRSVLRWARRWGLVAAAVVAFVAVGVTLAWPPSPEARHVRALRGVAEQLRRGELVELIGADGQPRSHRVRLGEGGTRTYQTGDGYFAAAGGRVTLVELLPDPELDRFRITAEARELGNISDIAEVGVYFSHQVAPTARGASHVFGYLGFADFSPLAEREKDIRGNPIRQARLRYACFTPPVAAGSDWSTYRGPYLSYPPPPPVPPGPWRRLEIEVTPEVVRASFDGVAFREHPVSNSQVWADALPLTREQREGLRVTLSPRGGVGLYVYGCEAAFRNVRIGPLP
jgi:eukaryotic-like serine/threonine-protein kinase